MTGCGTSEHGALGRGGDPSRGDRLALASSSAQAFELSLGPAVDGLVIGISHEGGTTATNAALVAARAAGAATALITVTDRSPGAALADVVVETDELDQSWCHTVGYLSPIAAAVGRGRRPDRRRRRRRTSPATLVAAGLCRTRPSPRPRRIAAALAGVDRLLVLASGADRIAGRELA